MTASRMADRYWSNVIEPVESSAVATGTIGNSSRSFGLSFSPYPRA